MGTAFAALPWAFSRLDVVWPWLGIDIGGMRWIGAVIFVLGITAYIACSVYLMTRGRGPYVEFDAPKAFVSRGPYAWVRNPIVLCVAMVVLGEALFFSSTGIFLLLLLVCVLAHLQVTRLEEPRLKRFGEPYERYLQQVPRWVPRPPRTKTVIDRK